MIIRHVYVGCAYVLLLLNALIPLVKLCDGVIILLNDSKASRNLVAPAWPSAKHCIFS